MKRNLHAAILSLVASLIFSAGIAAQDQTEVSIIVKKDGKVVKDTTYLFNDAAEANQVVKMIGVLSGDDEHMDHVTYNYTTERSEGDESGRLVFISEDGKKTEIKEFQGDTLVWVTEEDSDDIVKEKQIKVIVSGDEGGTWNMVTDEGDNGENVKVIIIDKNGDLDVDHDVDTRQDMDADQEIEVQVKVVKKEKEENK